MATIKNVFWRTADHRGLLKDTYLVDNDVLVKSALLKLTGKGDEKQVAGVDLETTGLDPQIKPTRIRLLTICYKKTVVVFDMFKLGPWSRQQIKAYLEDKSRVKVFHNAKFDLKFLLVELGIEELTPLFDTQIASQLMDLGLRFTKHDLQHCYEEFLGVKIFKDIRHGWTGDLSERQVVYSSNDASHLPELREFLIAAGQGKSLLRAFKLEFDAIWPTVLMEVAGFKLDRAKWSKVNKATRDKLTKVEDALLPMLPVIVGDTPGLFDGVSTFNIASNEQLKERLKMLDIELPTITDEDTELEKETLLSDKLAEIAHSHEIIPLVIEWGILTKALTSYGKKFLRYINPHDGRLHADFRQIGTVTSRYSVKEPPLHGIPKKSDHRECFVSEPGWKLVWADYSQIELRILAEFCEDEKMIRAFVEGKDLHAYTASDVFGVAYELVEEIQRRRAKDLNFGEVYGVGVKRFAQRAGIARDEAARLLAKQQGAYPKKTNYLKNAAGRARVNMFCKTMSGKIILFHLQDFPNTAKGRRDRAAAIGAIERHGKNYPIQGSSADITKRALRLEVDSMDHENAKLVNCVHDEIVLEVRDEYVQEQGDNLKRCMLEAGREFLKIVPVEVDVEVNDFWRKKKAE